MSETKETCPICGRPTAELVRPFCSTRCADVDLGRWLSDMYAIPVAPDEDPSDAPAPPGQPDESDL